MPEIRFETLICKSILTFRFTICYRITARLHRQLQSSNIDFDTGQSQRCGDPILGFSPPSQPGHDVRRDQTDYFTEWRVESSTGDGGQWRRE